jgi:hypothetical protein
VINQPQVRPGISASCGLRVPLRLQSVGARAGPSSDRKPGLAVPADPEAVSALLWTLDGQLRRLRRPA